MKRMPHIEAMHLDEEGLERLSKRCSFEVETEPPAQPRDRKTEVLQDLFSWPDRVLDDLLHANPEGYDRLKHLLLESKLTIKTF